MLSNGYQCMSPDEARAVDFEDWDVTLIMESLAYQASLVRKRDCETSKEYLAKVAERWREYVLMDTAEGVMTLDQLRAAAYFNSGLLRVILGGEMRLQVCLSILFYSLDKPRSG